MLFIGQQHIMNELSVKLPEIYSTRSGANILLRAPSGHGKTKMAISICNYLDGINYQFSLGDSIEFDTDKWVHFYDEIHLCKTPEILYPHMDSGEFVIILATNEFSELPEALMNRCTNFIFADYTDRELFSIIRQSTAFNFDDEGLKYIVESCARNPRIILRMISRLLMYERRFGKITELQTLINVFTEYFGIVDGLDVQARKYLEVLVRAGGRASLDTLASLIHVDKSTIRYLIEPILIYKGLVKINSRGRTIINEEL